MNVVKTVTIELNNEEIDALKCLVCLSDIDEIYSKEPEVYRGYTIQELKSASIIAQRIIDWL